MSGVGSPQYPQLNQSQSPIQTLGGVVQIQNAMNQNRLFQQQYNTNLAVSNIYKRAMKPDGTIDQEKLSGLLSSDPNASYGLPQAYQQSQEAQKRNIDIDIAKVNQLQTHLQAAAGYYAPLVKPGSTSADVASALAHATTNGVINTDQAGKVWSSLPRTPDGQIDESKIPIWAQQQQLQVMTAQERLNALSPAPTVINTGQSQVPMRFPQVGAPSLAGPGIQNELPPTTQRYNPQTQQMEFVGAQGGQSGVASSPGQSASSGGQIPAAASGAVAPASGGVAAGPPLGAPEAASTSAQFQAQQGNNLSARADQAVNNKAILGNLEGELGNFATGPGTESVAHFKKFVNTQLGTNIDTQGLSSREQFNKLAGMLAQSQFQALGGTGTDAKLDATTLTSPNSELTKLGNKGIIAMLKGNEDAISAKNQAWQAYAQQNGPGSYAKFAKDFNKSYDPRVFQAQYMSPQDQKKMLSGMTQAEKNQLFQSAQVARQNGWIK